MLLAPHKTVFPASPARLVRLSLVAVVAMVLSIATLRSPSPYSVIQPGSVLELGSRIAVPHLREHETGWLALTTIRAGRASYAAWVRSHFDSTAALVRTDLAGPPVVSEAEHRELLARWTASSKASAAIVALRQAGYPVERYRQGVMIDGIEPGSPAAAVLRLGDVIVRANEEPTPTVAALVEQVERSSPTAELQIDVLRRDDIVTLELPALAPADGHDWSLTDLQGWDYVYDLTLPFPIDIASEDVLGDSAGLMLGLSVLDVLTPGALPGTHRVAVTGTLTPDGRVGPISGVAAKVKAAERAGADTFLAPRENQAEAERAARSVRVIGVGTFEEALAALRALDASPAKR